MNYYIGYYNHLDFGVELNQTESSIESSAIKQIDEASSSDEVANIMSDALANSIVAQITSKGSD